MRHVEEKNPQKQMNVHRKREREREKRIFFPKKQMNVSREETLRRDNRQKAKKTPERTPAAPSVMSWQEKGGPGRTRSSFPLDLPIPASLSARSR